MANLVETSTWESGIYRIETNDPVQGGVGGLSNTQPNQLANRTKKIYDILADYGIFINPAEEDFVGQHSYINATFEGTVVDGNVVYWDDGNSYFAKAIADGSAAQYAIGIADVTNGKLINGGMIQTALSVTSGDVIYLSDTVAGTMTTSSTDIVVGRYEFDGVITWTASAAASASAASIAPGSITPTMLQESYYTETEIDTKCSNWDTAYTERHQWDGGATNLVAATARTSLELFGDVSTHNHDSMYYTETEIDTKCSHWDSAYDTRMRWDGGNIGLDPSLGRTNLELIGCVTTHCHDGRYYTESESDGRYARLAHVNSFTNTNYFDNHVEIKNDYGASLLYVCNSYCNSTIYAIDAYGCGAGIRTCGNMGYALEALGAGTNIGIRVSSVGRGVEACSSAQSAVAGNTAYFNFSSKFLKHNEDICISECIRNNPLTVYKYYWEDSNNKGFDGTIGPMAEDFLNTFSLGDPNQDKPDGIWGVDGIALGLGIENLNEIDKIKQIIIQLYEKIQILENK